MAEAAGLYYELHGPEDAPPLILSSGLGGSANYWEPNLPALAEHFRVLVYDHRGTGRSERTLPDTHVFDAGMTYDVIQLMDAIGIVSAHVIGHAAGAMIGLGLALEWPERVRSLVAVNGWAKADPHFLRCFEARLNLLRHSGVEAFLRAQPIFLYPANWISEHSVDLDAEFPHQLAAFPEQLIMERRVRALASFDIGESAQHILVPVQVLVADDDMLVPSNAGRLLAELLPKATLATMTWGGHACNVTDPDTFNRIVLDFLRS